MGTLGHRPIRNNDRPLGLLIYFLLIEGVLLGSWVIYNVYIRISRAVGRTLDIGIWVLASALTGIYTFWAWIVINLLYVGDAPVEYAVSSRSKQIRKLWEEARKAGQL